MEGLPKPAVESSAMVTESHLSTGPPERQRWPAEEQRGSAATAMSNRLQLATVTLVEGGAYRGLFQALQGATASAGGGAAAPGLRSPGWRGRVGLACVTGEV